MTLYQILLTHVDPMKNMATSRRTFLPDMAKVLILKKNYFSESDKGISMEFYRDVLDDLLSDSFN